MLREHIITCVAMPHLQNMTCAKAGEEEGLVVSNGGASQVNSEVHFRDFSREEPGPDGFFPATGLM